MGKKIHDFFTNNLLWKTVALLLAIVLWFIALNLENPLQNKDVNVFLDILNQDVLKENNLVILNHSSVEEAIIRVRLRGNKKTLDGLDSKNVSAYIDLAPANFSYSDKIGQTLTLQIDVDLPKGTDSTLADYRPIPSKIDVILDYYEEREEKVRVKLIQDAEDGYVAMEPVCEPSSVKISGAKSLIESIAEVRVEVELENTSDDSVTSHKPVVYDINNEDITDKLDINVEEITVTVPINKQDRILINTPNIRGYVADGYTIKDVNLSQNYIEVVGKDEDINKLSSISLDSINVSGANRTVHEVYNVTDILESYNLTVKEGSSAVVEVEVVIEAEVFKTFSLPLDRIEIIGDSSYAEFENQVAIRLRGQSELINSIDEASITGSMDISGLENGTHTIPVSVNTIEGLTQVGEASMTVIINNGVNGTEDPTEDDIEDEPTEDTAPESVY